MTSTFEFHPEAAAEVDEGILHYGAVSAELAEEFVVAVEEVVAGVLEAPEAFSLYLHGTRRALLRRFPFGLVYRVKGDHILIAAVAHTSRQPGYWSQRL